MQSWEDYEADYYGGYPYGNTERNRWNGRNRWPFPEPEDQLQTRVGNEIEPEDTGMNEYDRDGMRMNESNRNGMRMNESNWNGMRMDESNRNGMRMNESMEERDDLWNDLEEFEGLYDEIAMSILRHIREICDSMDGDGCVAMDGQLNREMLEMIVDRVVMEMGDRMRLLEDRWENDEEPMGERMQAGRQNRADVPANAAVPVISLDGRCAGPGRSLIEVLICQELLRRRHRRRRRRRNWRR